MKKNIHPESHPTCFIDVSTGTRFFTVSTVHSKGNKAKETVTHNNIEYRVYHSDMTSASHPVYTGQKRFVDTAGRLEKFNNKPRRGISVRVETETAPSA